MANLNSTNVGLNYKGIINLGATINTPLSTTLEEVTDGDGVSSPLSLATNRIGMAFPALTGSSATNALNITQTWNTTGSPALIQGTVTITASGGGSSLLRLGTNVNPNIFNVSLSGTIICGSSIYFGSNYLISGTSGIIKLANASANDFNRLQFGGATSSFPSIKRNGTGLDIKLADDSGFTFIQDLYRLIGSGTPEGAVTAPIGAMYSRTDGGAGTSFYVKESGVGNTGWVAK